MISTSPTAKVLLIAGHVSLTGLLYGLDTGSIGVITQMTQFDDSIGHLSSMQQGIYVASILLSSSVSSLTSGHVSDRISRRYGILIGSVISLLVIAISACSRNLASLILSRLVTGVGMGQAISVTTVYLVEIAPIAIRRVAACFLQTYVVFGIMTGYLLHSGRRISRGVPGHGECRSSFRLVVAAVLSLGMVLVPFSPEWLAQIERSNDAKKMLFKLRPVATVEAEFNEIRQSLDPEKQQQTANRRGAVLRPILFQQAGFTSQRASFLSSGVTGVVMLACTIPAQIWVDCWGRRKPLIFGGAAMAICFIVIGSLYAGFGRTEGNEVVLASDSAGWVVIVLIYIFVADFSWSWPVVGKIYASEVIPTRPRAKVCAVELMANWVINFLVTFTAPLFLRALPSGPYYFYGFSTVVAVIVCVLMPETKGHSLEHIELCSRTSTSVSAETAMRARTGKGIKRPEAGLRVKQKL